jgi:hypothetical protein
VLVPATTASAASIEFQEENLPDASYQAIAVDIRSRTTPTSEAERNRALAANGTSAVTAFWMGRIGTDDVVRGLLGYDISAIPAASTIDSVSLTLYPRGNDANSQNQDYTISVHQLEGTIIEGTGGSAETGTGPSWNDRDITGDNTPWTSGPGGDFSATVLSSVVDNPTTLIAGQGVSFPSSSDFVAAAQDALDGAGTLYLMVKSSSEDTSASERAFFNFASDDWADVAMHPKLSIDYTPIPEPSGLILAALVTAGLASASRRRRA